MSVPRGKGLTPAGRPSGGFTLIELLVVIAIIGILAAMLFPVFARARESARKIQCLSNVKNIATALQMYLTDYEKLPPWEHRPEALDYFASGPGGGLSRCIYRVQGWCTRANPYLEWPVILDEYVRHREVWKCPSAKVEGGAAFILPGPDWLGYLQLSEGKWGGGNYYHAIGPCATSWPPGWGGSVTDSIAQQQLATQFSWLTGSGEEAATHSFVQSIGANQEHCELKSSQVNDAAQFVVCADAGVDVRSPSSPAMLAYPELCCVECAGLRSWPDWSCGILASDCGPCAELHAPYDFFRDPRKQTAATRHLGGSNIGFMDGHASWIRAQLFGALYDQGNLEGIFDWCVSTEIFTQSCGDPTGLDFLH